MGIPDEYEGRIITKEFQYNSNVTTSTTLDTYIIQVPVPGYAALICRRAAGTTNQFINASSGVTAYTDFSTIYPSNSTMTTVVNQFRLASNIIELIPLMNQMTWSGSILVSKCNMQLEDTLTTFLQNTLGGTNGVNGCLSKPDAIFPGNHGCYAFARPCEPNYPFRSVLLNQLFSQVAGASSPGAAVTTEALFGLMTDGTLFPGVGALETTIIYLPATATAQTYCMRTRQCVEYQINSTSVLWEYSRISAPFDPLALRLLKAYCSQIPVACPFYDNESFWKRFVLWASKSVGNIDFLGEPINKIAKSLGDVGTNVADAYL